MNFLYKLSASLCFADVANGVKLARLYILRRLTGILVSVLAQRHKTDIAVYDQHIYCAHHIGLGMKLASVFVSKW
jgi:hypothetical protein